MSDYWKSKAEEDRQYAVPNGRLWKVYDRILKGNVDLEPSYSELRDSISVYEVLEWFSVPAKRGSSYLLISCPSPDHEDKHPSCQVWPSIKAFKCHSCGVSGDVIDLYRYLKMSESGDRTYGQTTG